MNNLLLKAEAMSCSHCVNSIESALTRLGVKGKANLKDKTVSVEFDAEKISLEKIQKSIEEAGYPTDIL